MKILEYIFLYVCVIGLCILLAIATLAGLVALISIAINFIKERIEDGK